MFSTQDQLGEIVYVELPEVGSDFEKEGEWKGEILQTTLAMYDVRHTLVGVSFFKV